MFNLGLLGTDKTEENNADKSYKDFKKLCQLCSANFSKEEVLAEEIDWCAIWKLAIRHRVVPVMADRIKALGIAVPVDVASLIADHVQKNLFKGMKQAAELVNLTKLFEGHGIPFVAFKGIALLKLMGLELHQRHHGDIDVLLADVEDVFKADMALRSAGYKRTNPPQGFSLNKHQEKYFKKYMKDVIYHHPEKSIQLELHFKLCLNDKLLPITSRMVYSNRSTVLINSHTVPVMNVLDHQVYLLVHGAVSRWFRLKWLCDIPLVSDNGQAYSSTDFLKRINDLDLRRVAALGSGLALELLSMPSAPGTLQYGRSSQIVSLMYKVVKMNLANDDPYHMTFLTRLHSLVVFSLIYRALFKKGTAYKLDHFRSYLTTIPDWEALKLPPYLFFLYFPLRPFLWLRRQF